MFFVTLIHLYYTLEIVDNKTDNKRRHWRWLGYNLKMDKNIYPKLVLTWIPQGQTEKKVKLKGTGRPTVVMKIKSLEMTWEIVGRKAQDRDKWRLAVKALYTDKVLQVIAKKKEALNDNHGQ